MKNRAPLIFLGLVLLSACDQNDAGGLPTPPKGICAEDIKDMRAQFADQLRSHNIDQPVFDRLMPELEQVQKVCDGGDEVRARALLMQVVIDEQIGSDDTTDRKVNTTDGQK